MFGVGLIKTWEHRNRLITLISAHVYECFQINMTDIVVVLNTCIQTLPADVSYTYECLQSENTKLAGYYHMKLQFTCNLICFIYERMNENKTLKHIKH